MRDTLSQDAYVRACATSALNVCVTETMWHDWHPRRVALACSNLTQKDQGKAFEAPKGGNEEGTLTWRHIPDCKDVEATYGFWLLGRLSRSNRSLLTPDSFFGAISGDMSMEQTV